MLSSNLSFFRRVVMQRKERPVSPNPAINVEKSSIPNLPQGGVLSVGVLAAVEGPGLVFDEFEQLGRSPKSELDPSTTANTPPLSRFLPPTNLPRPRSGPFSPSGGMGAASPHVCDFSSSRSRTSTGINRAIAFGEDAEIEHSIAAMPRCEICGFSSIGFGKSTFWTIVSPIIF